MYTILEKFSHIKIIAKLINKAINRLPVYQSINFLYFSGLLETVSGDILAAREVKRQYNNQQDVDRIYFNYPSDESMFLAFCGISEWLMDLTTLVMDLGQYKVTYMEDSTDEMLGKGWSHPETVNITLLNDLEKFYERWEKLIGTDLFPRDLATETLQIGKHLKEDIKSDFQKLLEYQLWRISLEYKFQQMQYSIPYIEDNYKSFIEELVVSTQFSRFVIDSASLLEDIGEMYLKEFGSGKDSVGSLSELIEELETEQFLAVEFVEDINEELYMELGDMFSKVDEFRDKVRNRYAHSIKERKEINHKEIMEIFPYILACLQSIESELSVKLHLKYDRLCYAIFDYMNYDY